MRRWRPLPLPLLLLTATPGCFAPVYESGNLACAEGERCPSGFRCGRSNRCWREGQEPPPLDAAADADDDGTPFPADADPERDAPLPAERPFGGTDMGGQSLEVRPEGRAGALLASLEVMPGPLVPAFDPDERSYSLNLPLAVRAVTIRATAARAGVQLSTNGTPLPANGTSAPLPLAVGANLIAVQAIVPDGASETYGVLIVRGGLSTYFKASNRDSGDRFGQAVAFSGDTLVVGAPYEASGATGINGNQGDDTAPESGAVYVFVRVAGVWSQQAFIKPANTTAAMEFGRSVALSGDTLVVGAPGESGAATGVNSPVDRNAPLAGAAYVFVRTGTTWAQQAYVKASNTAARDRFGAAVAVAGNTLAVGAPEEDSAATGINGNQRDETAGNAGAVYVFLRTGVTWAQQAYVKGSITKAENELGSSVALAGETLIVGAPKDDSGASGVNPAAVTAVAADSGAAVVFTRNGTIWTQQAVLKPSSTAPGFAFGTRVDVVGDLCAVGAPGEAGTAVGFDGDPRSRLAPASGAVYLFRRAGSAWAPQHYIKASNSEAGDRFGQALALTADTLIVGAPGEDSSATGPGASQSDNAAAASGAAYVFKLTGTAWGQLAYIKAANAQAGDGFGVAVAAAAEAVVISAEGEDGGSAGISGNLADNSANDSGAVYSF